MPQPDDVTTARGVVVTVVVGGAVVQEAVGVLDSPRSHA